MVFWFDVILTEVTHFLVTKLIQKRVYPFWVKHRPCFLSKPSLTGLGALFGKKTRTRCLVRVGVKSSRWVKCFRIRTLWTFDYLRCKIINSNLVAILISLLAISANLSFTIANLAENFLNKR
jgi:hypothetical protein